MRKLLHVFTYLFISIVIFISYALSDGYIPAEETGETKYITIKAKPDVIVSGTTYLDSKSSQIATWVDTAYKTDGNVEGFYMEITGGWNPWGGNYNTTSDLCAVATVNKNSPEIEVNGEFDYITSSYILPPDTTTFDLTPRASDAQKKCWLTAGSGLYIAFFGETGYMTPDLATHLKMADIACDAQYSTDKNGDGIFTIDECYDPNDPERNNQAYYVPYKSEYITGGVRCDLTSFKQKPGADINKIRVSDCLEEINEQLINRAIFTFKAPYLYKDSKKTRVPKNEVIKFTIYDSYYSDNVGEYNIKFYKGASTEQKEGVFEKIMKSIESMFSISTEDKNNAGEIILDSIEEKRQSIIQKIKDKVKSFFGVSLSDKYLFNNTKIILSTINFNNYNNINISLFSSAYAENNTTEESLYRDKVNLIGTFYNYIVRDSVFTNAIRILLALYISFFGLNLAMGNIQYSVKDAMNLLLRLTFVLVFTMPAGWDFYNKYVVDFFLYALMYTTTTIINIMNKIFDPFAYIYIPNGTSLSSIFINIDSTIFYLFSEVLANRLEALLFGHGWGFIIVIFMVLTILNTIIKITNAAFPIIISYMELVLALMLGPIFISFYLFKTTESICMNWLSFLGSRCLNIFFTVTILLVFTELIKGQYIDVFSYSIYKTDGWELLFFKVLLIIFGILTFGIGPALLKLWDFVVYVPDYTGTVTNTFWTLSGKVLGINVILQLFGVITKHLPSVVDSLVDIKGGKGGKMKDIVGNTSLFQTTDIAISDALRTKRGTPYLSYLESYSSVTGAMTGVYKLGKKLFGDSFEETINNFKNRKERKENNEKTYINDKLYAASSKVEGSNFKDLFKDKDKMDALVNSIYNNEKNVKFSDDKEENRKFHELRKYYILMKNEENFGKYIRDEKIDFASFLKDHPELSQEDREMLADSIITQINLNTDFDYYDRTKELANRLASFDPDKATDEEAEKLRKDLEELQRFRNDLEELIMLKSGQGNNSVDFLMSGIDLDRFGLSGAKNFTAIAGINASSFLGFNNGAANISSGMGIQLFQKDDTNDDKDNDSDKQKILHMKDVNTFQMNNSLVSLLTTKINEKRKQFKDLTQGTFVSRERDIKNKEIEEEINSLISQRSLAQKRVYDVSNNTALLDALENLTEKSKDADNSEYKKLDIENSRELLMKELKNRYNVSNLNDEEIERFNNIVTEEEKIKINTTKESVKKVGKSLNKSKEEEEQKYEKEKIDLENMRKKHIEEYTKYQNKNIDIVNSGMNTITESIRNQEKQIKELSKKKYDEKWLDSAKRKLDLQRKNSELKKSKQELENLEKSKKTLQRYQQMEEISIQQEKAELEQIKEDRKKLLDTEKEVKCANYRIVEFKKIIEENENLIAKNKVKLLSFELTDEEKDKLQAENTRIQKENKILNKRITQQTEISFNYSKEYKVQTENLKKETDKMNSRFLQKEQINKNALDNIEQNKKYAEINLKKAQEQKNIEEEKKLQELIKNYDSYIKYYQDEQKFLELQKSMFKKEQERQRKQHEEDLKRILLSAKREIDKEYRGVKKQKENEKIKEKTTYELIKDKQLKLATIKKELQVTNNKDLLAEKNEIELDLKYLKLKQKEEKVKEYINRANAKQAEKWQEANKQLENLKRQREIINSEIHRRKNGQESMIYKDISLDDLKLKQKNLDQQCQQYVEKCNGYYNDKLFFENKEKEFNEQQNFLEGKYNSKFFISEHQANDSYILAHQNLLQQKEKEVKLQQEKEKFELEKERLKVEQEGIYKKYNSLQKYGTPVEQTTQSFGLKKEEFKNTKDKIKSSVNTLINSYERNKQKEAVETAEKELLKSQQLETLENKKTTIEYKEEAIKIQEEKIKKMEEYCAKYIDGYETATKASETKNDFASFINEAALTIATTEKGSQSLLNTIKNTQIVDKENNNSESLYNVLQDIYLNKKDNMEQSKLENALTNLIQKSYDNDSDTLSTETLVYDNKKLFQATMQKTVKEKNDFDLFMQSMVPNKIDGKSNPIDTIKQSTFTDSEGNTETIYDILQNTYHSSNKSSKNSFKNDLSASFKRCYNDTTGEFNMDNFFRDNAFVLQVGMNKTKK